MYTDVVDLRDFYATRLGQVARRLLRRRIRLLWPELGGMRVLGLGYATPFLRPFAEEAERVVALMPAGEGGPPRPRERPHPRAPPPQVNAPLPELFVCPP